MNMRALILCSVFTVACLLLSVDNLHSPLLRQKPKHTRLDNIIKYHDKNGNLVSYDRIGAANWAKAHAHNPLKGFAVFGTNDKGEPDGSADCVNFASQSLHFGGGIPYSDDWHGGSTEADCTLNWVSTPELADYLTDQGYACISGNASPSGYTLPNLENAQEGDLLQWYDPTNGWHHTAVITKVDDGGNVSFSEHSPSHDNRPLLAIWPTNIETGKPGEPYRLIQIGHDADGNVLGRQKP